MFFAVQQCTYHMALFVFGETLVMNCIATVYVLGKCLLSSVSENILKNLLGQYNI